MSSMIIDPYNVTPAFTPKSIPNLAYWLTADKGVNLIGGKVDSWEDQSGNARDFLAPGASARPNFNATFANGKAYVVGDDVNQVLRLSGYTEQYRTVSIAFKLNGNGAVAPNAVGCLYQQQSGGYFEIYSYPGPNNIFLYLWGNVASHPIDNAIHYFTYAHRPGFVDVYYDGVFAVAMGVTDMNNNNTKHTIFNTEALDSALDAGIRNVINYSRGLTAPELVLLHAYQASQI